MKQHKFVNVASKEFVKQMIEFVDTKRKLDELFEIVVENDPRKWTAIRGIYGIIGTDEYSPYPVDWTRIFTPIEKLAWNEIRYLSLPFYPQFPVGKYFADFADPKNLIAIECDGAAYHNVDNDSLRNGFFSSQGWTVYRVSGADCNRVIDIQWDEIDDDFDDLASDVGIKVKDWLYKTVEGFVWALAHVHYNGHFKHKRLLQQEAMNVLSFRNGER